MVNSFIQHKNVWKRQLGAANDSGDKNSAYGDIPRSALVDLVNKQRPPKMCLDIGCNCGGTSAYVKKVFPECKTFGVEMNKQAAEVASKQVDCVLVGKFEDLHESGELEKNGILPNSLDLVICADVLEHMYDPWRVLVILKKYLKRDGILLISIPNIRHLSTFADLGCGYFRYADFGILDITHIRFFTLREFQRALQETGYSINTGDILFAPDGYLYKEFYLKYKDKLPCDIKLNSKLTLHNVDDAELSEFCAIQFYIQARNWEGFPLKETQYDTHPEIPLFCFNDNYKNTEHQLFLNQRDFYTEESHNISNLAELIAYHNNIRSIKAKIENAEVKLDFQHKYLCDIFVFVNAETQNKLINTLNSIVSQTETYFKNSFRVVVFGDQSVTTTISFPLNIREVLLAHKIPNCDLFYIKEALTSFESRNETSQFSIILDAGDIIVQHTMALLSKFAIEKNADKIPDLIYADEAILNSDSILADKTIFKNDFTINTFLENPTFLGNNIIWNNDSLKQINYFDDNNFSTSILKLFLKNKESENKENNIYHLPEVLFKINQQRTLNRYPNSYKTITKFINSNNINKLIISTDLVTAKNKDILKIEYKLNRSKLKNITWITKSPNNLEDCRNLLEKYFVNLQSRNINLNLRLALFVDEQNIEKSALIFIQNKLDEYQQKPTNNLLVLLLNKNENYWSAVDDFIKNKDNNAYEFAENELILLLDSFCNFKNTSQLGELVGLLEQQNSKIGIVTPLIVDTNNRIIGNAMILGCQGFAAGFADGVSALENKIIEANLLNINERIITTQNPLAMTFMAQLFSRNNYLKVGGFNTKDLQTETAIAIDFCLKFNAIFNDEVQHIWTPHITLKASKNNYISCLTESETDYLLTNYIKLISDNKFYNNNYSRKLAFQLRSKEQNLLSRIDLPHIEIAEEIVEEFTEENATKNTVNLVEKSLPKLLSLPLDVNSGTAFVRIIEPTLVAIQENKIFAKIVESESINFATTDILFDCVKNNSEAIFLQRQLFFAEAFLLKQIKKHTNAKIIHDVDDLITRIPTHNQYKIDKSEDELKNALLNTLQYTDLFTVSTPDLANFYDKYHNNIKVIPNRLDKNIWYNLPVKQQQERQNNKFRVGFFGNYGHTTDVQIITPIVKELANEIDFIFFGYCPPELKPIITEYHDFVDTKYYPQKLASLDLDLVLAPIETDLFNTCKSNLKILQSGILGYPVIATNYGPYEDSEGHSLGLPICRVKNTIRAWKKAILDHINNPEETFNKGLALREAVIKYGFIQDHLNDYLSAWFDD